MVFSFAQKFGDPGWQDKQDQEKLRPNTAGWDSFWATIGGGINDATKNVGNFFADADRNAGNATRERLASNGYATRPAPPANSANGPITPYRLPGLRSGGGEAEGIPESLRRPPEGPSEDELRMQELKALLEQDFKPSGESSAMIDAAYASALANIGKARGDANANFQKSDARIADLTSGHVNEIKTADRAAVNKIGGDLQSSYKDTYGDARAQLKGDQSAEMKAKTEMLQRLGIQEAGVGTAGQSESEALTRLTQNEAGAMQQAQGYQAADLTRNVEQAQSQASAGVERRSALNRDLQKILGSLSDSEGTVKSSIAMAKMQGAANEKNDWRQQQQFNLESLKQMEDKIQGKADKDRDYALELQKLNSKASGNGGAYASVSNDIQSRGIDPTPYLETYSDIVATQKFNPQIDGDKNLWIIRKMKEKNPGLSSAEIGRWVNGLANFGTDKLN